MNTKKTTLVLFLLVGVMISSCNLLKGHSANKDDTALAGTWVLNYITGPRIAFEGLYPEKKPTITFDLDKNEINGNTSCNSFGSAIVRDNDKIKFDNPLSTMMACPGNGEATFVSTLLKVETYKVNGDTLSFYTDGIEMMRFAKQ
ncbi:META domain-containing protein [Albibacterium bauzanense]|uniref:META domain-containing protein n=1 Tax=Albibacterium bauzanense TaxID=653929 RepID=A0A4R1LNG6_9SPHI|nr:META domain-containing protein [Albibacterium bauzanense]TCK80578.1 META domain-containing protein [Albibacterium bauzanense]